MSIISPMRSCTPRKSRRATNSLAPGRQVDTDDPPAPPFAKEQRRTCAFADAKLIHAHGKPASFPLPSHAGSTKTEKAFRRAYPASIDTGAVHGGHHDVCLRLYPDYNLGLSVPMGPLANRLASSRSLVPGLCADVRDATLACGSAKCPGFHRPLSVGFHRIWSIAGPSSGSAFARVHPLSKYLPLSVRSILHCDRDRLAMDLQPGDWH